MMKAVPSIARHSNKRFAAGSSMYCDGGTWEALRDTDEPPHASSSDWIIRANGIAELRITLDPERGTVAVACRLTDGTEDCQTQCLPSWHYRGAWHRDQRYHVGDWITHNGSAWLAMRIDPGVPGEEGNGWRLAVRKGRDGRNCRGCSSRGG